MASQKSLEKLEKGWSTKFKKAKALEEQKVPPLYRPVSKSNNRKLNASTVAVSELGPGSPEQQTKVDIEPIDDLNNQEKMEYRKLKRRFGNQPANFSQAKKQKVHELVDDAENDPSDNRGPGNRMMKVSLSKKEWDNSKKTKLELNLPQLVNNNGAVQSAGQMRRGMILRGSASVDNYARVVKHQDPNTSGLGMYPTNNRQAQYLRHRYSEHPSTTQTKQLANARVSSRLNTNHQRSNSVPRGMGVDPDKVVYKSNYR